MSKRNDGNEDDLRVRPFLDAKSLESDNPFTGAHPDDKDPCEDGHGEQVEIPPTPPDNGDSEESNYDWSDSSLYCPQGFSKATLNKFFMRVLKNHFSNADNIFNEELKSFVYSPNPQESKIRIVMNTDFNTFDGARLPAIVVKRGRQRYQRIVMGDRGSGGEPITEGTQHYARAAQGTHRILTMAVQDGVTELLGDEVDFLFQCLSPVFRSSAIPFHDFQVTDCSELGFVEDLGNQLAVAIECVYVYEYGWTLRQVAPRLRGTNVDLDVTLRVIEESNP